MERNYEQEFLKLFDELDVDMLYQIYYMLLGYMQGVEKQK